MNLVILGGSLPTFLPERIIATSGASNVEPRPPQVVRLHDAVRTPEFDTPIPLIDAEKLDWKFVDRSKQLSDFGLIENIRGQTLGVRLPLFLSKQQTMAAPVFSAA